MSHVGLRWSTPVAGIVLAVSLLLFAAGAPPVSAQTPECTGVQLEAGADIQASLTAASTGTVFCLAPGIYRPSAPLAPRAGQQLIGAPGAILDGDGTFDGFYGYGRPGVVVRGLEIRNFKGGMQTGPSWLVENNDIHGNRLDGARLHRGTTFRNNRTHHNLRGGLFGYGENITVVGNEIDHNQIEHHPTDPHICSQKFVWTVDLVIRDNFVHHNNCPSLWVDINGYNALIEHNLVEDNVGEAIDCEISYACVIRYNVVRDNTKGIYAASSPDVEIYGNTVTNNLYFGIRVTQQGTTSGIRTDHPSSYGPHVATNNHVYDNVVTMNGGFSGVTKFGNVGDGVFSAAANNRFRDNKYYVPSRANHFNWKSGNISWADWKAAGHDTGGSYVVGEPPPQDEGTAPDDGTTPSEDSDQPGDQGKECNVTGSDHGETLVGSPGPDVICGKGGNDRLIGRGGNDVLIGGAGSDEVDYRRAPRSVRVNLRRGRGVGHGVDKLESIEKVAGSRYGDRLLGSGGRDELRGRGGPDTIRARAGSDRLYGGRGRDVLRGQRGRDRVFGGAGKDRCRS